MHLIRLHSACLHFRVNPLLRSHRTWDSQWQFWHLGWHFWLLTLQRQPPLVSPGPLERTRGKSSSNFHTNKCSFPHILAVYIQQSHMLNQIFMERRLHLTQFNERILPFHRKGAWILTCGPQRGPLVTQQISMWQTVQRNQSHPSLFCTMMPHWGQCIASPDCTRVCSGVRHNESEQKMERESSRGPLSVCEMGGCGEAMPFSVGFVSRWNTQTPVFAKTVKQF